MVGEGGGHGGWGWAEVRRELGFMVAGVLAGMVVVYGVFAFIPPRASRHLEASEAVKMGEKVGEDAVEGGEGSRLVLLVLFSLGGGVLAYEVSRRRLS